MRYRELQGVTESYRELQGATGNYSELQGATESYRELQGATGRYRELQGATESYRELQGATGSYRALQRLQRVTGRYRVQGSHDLAQSMTRENDKSVPRDLSHLCSVEDGFHLHEVS